MGKIVYAVPMERIIMPCGFVIYENVSFPDWECIDELTIALIIDEVKFPVLREKIVFTHILTRLENVDASEYAYRKSFPHVSDYVKTTKELLGIDMSKNVYPDFRDGINPARDNGDKKNINTDTPEN